MIEKIESASDFEEWQQRDIFTVRILALLQSYGTKYPFAVFYKQVIDGHICAILSKLDNHYTLSVSEEFDREELVRFFCVSGYASVLSSDTFEFSERYEEGAVMVSTQKREPALTGVSIDEYPKLMDLYNFIDYDGQDFQAWYVDISHRVRHQTAKAYTLCLDEEIIASGILSSVIKDYAILTAVRTEEAFRHMGYGSALVSYICADMKGSVYIMRDNACNEAFYQQLGFKTIGKWRMYQ